jgi:hypothetical protein
MTQNTTSAQRPRLAAVITAHKRLLHGLICLRFWDLATLPNKSFVS